MRVPDASKPFKHQAPVSGCTGYVALEIHCQLEMLLIYQRTKKTIVLIADVSKSIKKRILETGALEIVMLVHSAQMAVNFH